MHSWQPGAVAAMLLVTMMIALSAAPVIHAQTDPPAQAIFYVH
jgi:hypothetical protein